MQVRIRHGWIVTLLSAGLLALAPIPPAHAESNTFRFVMLSDVHVGDNLSVRQLRYVQMVDEITNMTPRPAAVFVTGDFVDCGSNAEYDAAVELFLTPLQTAGIPFYAIPGNHEIATNTLAVWTNRIGPIYQAVTIEDTHFILTCGLPEDVVAGYGEHSATNSDPAGVGQGGWIETNQLAWIRAELEAATNAGSKLTFIVNHFALWKEPEPIGDYRIRDVDYYGSFTGAGTLLKQWVGDYGVAAWFFGHRHFQIAPIYHTNANGSVTLDILNESSTFGDAFTVTNDSGNPVAAGVYGYDVYDVAGASFSHFRKTIDTYHYDLLGPVNVWTYPPEEIGPAVSLATGMVTVTEGPGVQADFVVQLNPAATNDVTVEFASYDGSAGNTVDYVGTNGTLTFIAGETSKTVTVAIVDDAEFEWSETFGFELSGVSNAAWGAITNATCTILNDDASTAPAAVTNTGTAVAGVTAQLTGRILDGSGCWVTFYWGTNDGAIGGAWMTNTAAQGPFEPGQSFTNSLSELSATTTYWYACFASNGLGTNLAQPSVPFVTGSASSGGGGNGALEWDPDGVQPTSGGSGNWALGMPWWDGTNYVAWTDYRDAWFGGDAGVVTLANASRRIGRFQVDTPGYVFNASNYTSSANMLAASNFVGSTNMTITDGSTIAVSVNMTGLTSRLSYSGDFANVYRMALKLYGPTIVLDRPSAYSADPWYTFFVMSGTCLWNTAHIPLDRIVCGNGTLGNGAVIGGTGSVDAAVALTGDGFRVNPGAALAPGDPAVNGGVGTLTLSHYLRFQKGPDAGTVSAFRVRIGGPTSYDQVVVVGTNSSSVNYPVDLAYALNANTSTSRIDISIAPSFSGGVSNQFLCLIDNRVVKVSAGSSALFTINGTFVNAPADGELLFTNSEGMTYRFQYKYNVDKDDPTSPGNDFGLQILEIMPPKGSMIVVR